MKRSGVCQDWPHAETMDAPCVGRRRLSNAERNERALVYGVNWQTKRLDSPFGERGRSTRDVEIENDSIRSLGRAVVRTTMEPCPSVDARDTNQTADRFQVDMLQPILFALFFVLFEQRIGGRFSRAMVVVADRVVCWDLVFSRVDAGRRPCLARGKLDHRRWKRPEHLSCEQATGNRPSQRHGGKA